MIARNKNRLYRLLRWSERYTKTDMVYFMSGNFWLLSGRVIATGSGFLLTIAFANLLTPEAFGAYKYILAIAGFVSAFCLNGLGNAALRAIGKGYISVIPSLFRASLIWSLPASVFALVGATYYLYMGNPTLGWSLVVIAVLNPLTSNLGIAKSFFVATGDFKRATFYNTIRTVAQISVIMVTLFFTKNILIIASSFFIASAVVGYATYWHSLRVLNVKNDQTHLAETLNYTKHVSVLGVLQLVTGQLDQLLLWHFAGPVALATYAIALGPTRELRTISENITTLTFPKIVQKTKEEAAEIVRIKSRRLLLGYLFFATVYAISAPFAFQLFFPQYMDAVLPSQILAFGLIFQTRSLADLFLFAHGGIKDRYRVIIPSQIIRAVLYCVFIPLYGLYGAVAAIMFAELGNLATVAYAYRVNRRA